MKRRLVIGLLIAGAIIVALWASTMLIAVTDRAYICENTGSRKGHREWFFGAHTNPWYRKSELERFMEAKHPDLLKHRWTSYMGSGRSLIPLVQSCGHGRPGPIFFLDSNLLDNLVLSVADDQRLVLYRTFSEANKEAIQMKIDSIIEPSIRKAEQDVPSDGHKPSSRVPSDGPTAPADAH
jgi:hypothetical protein